MPWQFVGLAHGGFELSDPLAPAMQPPPGVAEAQAPLAWYDSAAVSIGEGAPWRGFGSALVSAEGIVRPPGSRKPRAVWTAASGSSALDANGLFLTRGDEHSWLRGGAIGFKRGGLGDMDVAGNHLWTLALGMRRGDHRFDASFAQRGMGERQRLGLGEGARGESGAMGWRWNHGAWRAAGRLSRGHDGRDDYGVGGDLDYRRRDADQDRAEVSVTHVADGDEQAVRIAVDDGGIVRWTRTVDDVYSRQVWHEHSVWAAVRDSRPVGGGRLELTLGGGQFDAPLPSPAKVQLAPGLAWRLEQGGVRARLFAERAVDPVWSDLSAGTAPFIQDSWTAGFEAAAGTATAPFGGSLGMLTGRVDSRATILRYPIRDFALAFGGWEQDPGRYDFALATVGGHARWRGLAAEGSAWVMTRGRSASQPRVDPGAGARAALDFGFRLFTGDLGVRLRGESAYIGARGTDTRTGLFEETTLPGYGTFAASVALTLGDATVRLRADGLENVRHPLTWADPSQSSEAGSVLARDSGRTYRFELVWPLFN